MKQKNKCNFTDRELLDCPFCENEYNRPVVTMSYYNEYLGRQYFVECTNCGATSAHKAYADYAVDVWNRRRDNDKSVNREVDNIEHKRNYIYIVDNNADPEFTIGTISVDAVFAKYEKAVEYIEKQGFEHLQDDIYVCEPYGQYVEIKMYEVQE